ncbi:substrate-binding periplasmic protein [Pseudoalteromonas pernae]|uniref:substrate-binding periplasmic protein n=1 Tax=Pseudoalteromonas pernae TaxID=3118054 RepID=UPI0032429740
MYARWLLICFLLLPMLAQAKCAEPIRVGVNTHWPPYIILTDRAISGTDMEIVALLAASMDECVEFVRLPSSVRLLTELEANRVDLVPGASFTNARLQYGVYSNTYREEEVRLLINTNSVTGTQTGFEELLELGKYLVINAGAYYGPQVERLRTDPRFTKQIFDVATPIQRYRMLLLDRVDMALEDKYVAMHLKHAYPGSHIKFHPTVMATEDVHFLISHSKGTAEFMVRLNRAIDENKEAIAQILEQGYVVQP